MIRCSRYHDFSSGHRVAGHESKCRFLHGHNYRVHFTAAAPELDSLGRVVDFSVLKSTLCQWLEDAWDHKTLIWSGDILLSHLLDVVGDSIVVVPFNPTAENMASYLLHVVGPNLLPLPLRLVEVRVDETRKCSAEALL